MAEDILAIVVFYNLDRRGFIISAACRGTLSEPRAISVSDWRVPSPVADWSPSRSIWRAAMSVALRLFPLLRWRGRWCRREPSR
jgi:hypothetical protein